MDDHNSTPKPQEPATTEMSMARREKGKLEREEVEWITENHLAAFRVFCSELDNKARGERKTAGVKGEKGTWISKNVMPGFIKKFNPDRPGGYTMQSVVDKVNKWCINHRHDATSQRNTSRASSMALASSSKPRATNAINLFAQDQKSTVTQAMNQKRKDSGQTVQKGNLREWHSSKKELFDALPQEAQDDYARKAEAHNARLKDDPPPEHVYENQKEIVMNTMQTLQQLIGEGWRQHGRVVYFTMGAYRDEREKLRTFHLSVGPSSRRAMQPFDETVDPSLLKASIKAPFKHWALNALPIMSSAKTEGKAAGLEYDDDGYPLLPDVNIEDFGPAHVKLVLVEFMKSAWDHALPERWAFVPIPWSHMQNKSKRAKIAKLVDTMADYESLDPGSLSRGIVYDLYTTIFDAQRNGQRSVQFVLDDILLASLQGEGQLEGEGDEIEEVNDPVKETPKDIRDHDPQLTQEDMESFQKPKGSVPGVVATQDRPDTSKNSHDTQKTQAPPPLPKQPATTQVVTRSVTPIEPEPHVEDIRAKADPPTANTPPVKSVAPSNGTKRSIDDQMPIDEQPSAKRQKASLGALDNTEDLMEGGGQPSGSRNAVFELQQDKEPTHRRSGRARKQTTMWPKPAADVLPPPPPPGTKRLPWAYENAATKEVFEETDPKYLAKLKKGKGRKLA
ncbi:hypothetical protein BKA70DRAFT_1300590 [Coprinopsis sp. MPI-PUGE-AT-0042]|nr:hypothetical protein BKA70DRAFT_1300590 [Coprinopsis sp. MPI-PUGE-AT-0042]